MHRILEEGTVTYYIFSNWFVCRNSENPTPKWHMPSLVSCYSMYWPLTWVKGKVEIKGQRSSSHVVFWQQRARFGRKSLHNSRWGLDHPGDINRRAEWSEFNCLQHGRLADLFMPKVQKVMATVVNPPVLAFIRYSFINRDIEFGHTTNNVKLITDVGVHVMDWVNYQCLFLYV